MLLLITMTSDEFRALRKKMRLTQTRLAALMGMPQPAVARIETGGRQPTRQQAAHILMLCFLVDKGLFDEFEKIQQGK